MKKKSTFGGEERMEIIKEISNENSDKEESKYLQRKTNHNKEENKEVILIKKEKSEKQDDFKRQEDLKKLEELKREEELKKLEELKKQEELKKHKDLKGKEEIKNDGYNFICFFDNRKFLTQYLYIEHFIKEHAAFCCICGKEFESTKVLQIHYNSKKSHNKIKCKLCGKVYITINGLKSHCKVKGH